MRNGMVWYGIDNQPIGIRPGQFLIFKELISTLPLLVLEALLFTAYYLGQN
jgi:hypothetical protein